MTLSYPNRSPIGVEYTVGDRTFVARTPRWLLADALEDEARHWEAALLRGPDPVILGTPIHPPHVGDVVELLHHLVPAVRARGHLLLGRSAREHDAIQLMIPAGLLGLTYHLSALHYRWRAANTILLYTILRGRRVSVSDEPMQVIRRLIRTGVPMEYVPD